MDRDSRRTPTVGGEPCGVERGSQDRRRFIASLFAGQCAGVLALVVLGGVLAPMLLAFMGAAAGCFVVAEPRRAQ
jgi:hypothetical protein